MQTESRTEWRRRVEREKSGRVTDTDRLEAYLRYKLVLATGGRDRELSVVASKKGEGRFIAEGVNPEHLLAYTGLGVSLNTMQAQDFGRVSVRMRFDRPRPGRASRLHIDLTNSPVQALRIIEACDGANLHHATAHLAGALYDLPAR